LGALPRFILERCQRGSAPSVCGRERHASISRDFCYGQSIEIVRKQDRLLFIGALQVLRHKLRILRILEHFIGPGSPALVMHESTP